MNILSSGALDGGVDGEHDDEEEQPVEDAEDGHATSLGVWQPRPCKLKIEMCKFFLSLKFDFYAVQLNSTKVFSVLNN